MLSLTKIKIMKIELDDVTYTVEFDNDCFKSKGVHYYYSWLDILLTEKQRENYIKKDTCRTFEVSNKRIRQFTNTL